MTGRYRVVPAAYVLLLREAAGPDGAGPGNTEVLLQLRHNTGYRDGHWATAAAGHVEEGESVVLAACREAAEELGITVRPEDLVPLTAMHRTNRTGDPLDERVDFIFTCRSWDGQPRLLESHKAAALGWFPLDALPEPAVPHELALLYALRDGAVPAVTTFGFGAAGARRAGPGQPNSIG